MTSIRYDNGKIYRITNNIDNMIYIGSTCLPLRKRLYCHKKEQHSGKGQNRWLCASRRAPCKPPPGSLQLACLGW